MNLFRSSWTKKLSEYVKKDRLDLNQAYEVLL
jgi:hypothetical protein